MNRSKAIKRKCLECSGKNKEVTLCHIFDCPLWEYRTGNHISSKAYKRRMKKALKNYQKELKELKKEGIDISLFKRNGKWGLD